jgi:hypothetical protein
VDRGHEALLDADGIVEDLGDRREQFVVQDAFETTSGPASSLSWLTP